MILSEEQQQELKELLESNRPNETKITPLIINSIKYSTPDGQAANPHTFSRLSVAAAGMRF